MAKAQLVFHPGPEHRLAIPSQDASIKVSGDLSGLGAAFAQAEPPAGGDGDVDRLSKLAELHASGALTDEEFAAAKARATRKADAGPYLARVMVSSIQWQDAE